MTEPVIVIAVSSRIRGLGAEKLTSGHDARIPWKTSTSRDLPPATPVILILVSAVRRLASGTSGDTLLDQTGNKP